MGLQAQELLWSFGAARKRVEVWLTSCIVSSSPAGSELLIVPANERLVGTQFTYFPVGGPTPVGREIGSPQESRKELATRLLYACESVDGLVSDYGGFPLDVARRAVRLSSGDEDYPIRCPAGEARRTEAGGLASLFPRGLVHAVAPFYGDDRWRETLARTYEAAFRLAFRQQTHIVLTPLLGAGARGLPLPEAASVAATAARAWYTAAAAAAAPATSSSSDNILRFGLQHQCDAEILVAELESDFLADEILTDFE